MYTATTLVTTFVPPIVSVWKKKNLQLSYTGLAKI